MKMKFKLIFVPLALSLCIGCKKNSDIPSPNDSSCKVELTKGLLAYYPFNGNANDASGNGNNGVAVNGAFFTTDYFGRPSRAAGFDGVNDYIIVNDGGKLNSDTVTISLLVQVNSINRRHSLIGRWNFASASALSWGIGQTHDVENKWDFGAYNTPCATTYTYSSSDHLSYSEAMQAGRWYNIICSFADGTQKIYVDGVLKGTLNREFKKLSKCENGQLLIGAWWQNDIVSIDGKIDEVRIYKRLLTTCEITELSSGYGE